MRLLRMLLFILHATLLVLEVYAKKTSTPRDDEIIADLLQAVDKLDNLL